MTIGPGKYDKEAMMVQRSTDAVGVVVIVIGGDRGEGFSIVGTLDVTLGLPKMLRAIADQTEADIKENGLIPRAEHHLDELNKVRVAMGKKPWTSTYKGED